MHILWFKDTGIDKVAQVGGKNASLGEMLRELGSLDIKVPDGFSVTADAYRYFLKFNDLESIIKDIFEEFKHNDVANMAHHARKIRNLIHDGDYPENLKTEILEAYYELSSKTNLPEAYVAVRSSATAEDLPNASFAGQQESYLMVHGAAELLDTIKRAFASLFTTRAISYREDMGFDHFQVALSVGVQQMVRSDNSSSGVMFTLDTETGFRNVVFINSIWGLGWRGASRYYHPDYKEGFVLEIAAVKRVHELFGFENLKVMVPFCRTVEEGKRVLEVMSEGGLIQGKDGLEVYVMAELPSNILQAAEFAKIFDGFSIGSNDLTQLTLGVDRGSERIVPLFDEHNEAVKRACAMLITEAHKHGRKVGICGQTPSDYPEFAAFLVEQGIDSISLSPDSVLRTSRKILEVERLLV